MSGRTPTTIGIVREVYSKWERRSPLTPEHVKRLLLVGNGKVKVVVQPSRKRVFTDNEFLSAGAVVMEDLSSCDALLGVKQVKVRLACSYFMLWIGWVDGWAVGQRMHSALLPLGHSF